jgi:2-dehydro-3-deoxy-D-arabinonate dehydratase
MRLIKFSAGGMPHVGMLEGQRVIPLSSGQYALTELLHTENPTRSAFELARQAGATLDLGSIRLLAPIDDQEVWGAGLTYERSKQARHEESEQGGSCYDRVYRAPRPELFFKATPGRVVGPDEAIRVRSDSCWSVPEPELALVISPRLEHVGFTIGNDVSARDIEGENPLYLPQAKIYDACCALGPAITLTPDMPPLAEIEICLEIDRLGQRAWEGKTTAQQMVRSFRELIDWLGRDNHFPGGVILLTGTGIVPPSDFSLREGDIVRISISGIGTLCNSVIRSGA